MHIKIAYIIIIICDKKGDIYKFEQGTSVKLTSRQDRRQDGDRAIDRQVHPPLFQRYYPRETCIGLLLQVLNYALQLMLKTEIHVSNRSNRKRG